MSGKVETNVQPATEQSIQEFMNGEAHMPGARHDELARGMGTRIGEANFGQATPIDDGQSFISEPNYLSEVNQPQQLQDPQDFRKLYGQSENEKGQYRRTAEQLAQLVEDQRRELENMRATFYQNQQPQYGYATPSPTNVGYAQYQQPQQPQQQPPLPANFFPDKREEELVEVKDVNELIRNTIAPAVWQLQQQQQQLYTQQVAAMKITAGITPQLEQNVLRSHPWVANVPDGPPRIQAIQDILRAAGNRQTAPGQTAQPTQPVHPAQAAARRVTYVEPNGTSQSPDNEQSLGDRIKAEFFGAKSAFEKRKVLEKYGMGRANEFGSDTLTR